MEKKGTKIAYFVALGLIIVLLVVLGLNFKDKENPVFIGDGTLVAMDDGTYRVFEQVDPHAFDECDMSDVIMQYDHEGRVFARTKNGTLRLAPDENGLQVTAELGGTEIGRQLYAEIKGGYTDKMSFGFVVGEDKREVTRDHENHITTVMRTITKIKKLYDVSAVSLPANDATSISARKFTDGVIGEIKAERLKRANTAKKIKLTLLGV